MVCRTLSSLGSFYALRNPNREVARSPPKTSENAYAQWIFAPRGPVLATTDYMSVSVTKRP